MKAVSTMAATAPSPRHKPRRTGTKQRGSAELLWPPKARDVEHGLQRGVRLLPGLNRLLALGVMAALVMVVHRSDSSVRMEYGRVRKFVRCSPRAPRGRARGTPSVRLFGVFSGATLTTHLRYFLRRVIRSMNDAARPTYGHLILFTNSRYILSSRERRRVGALWPRWWTWLHARRARSARPVHGSLTAL